MSGLPVFSVVDPVRRAGRRRKRVTGERPPGAESAPTDKINKYTSFNGLSVTRNILNQSTACDGTNNRSTLLS